VNDKTQDAVGAGASRRWLTVASAVALAILILAVFAPVRHFDFVDLDDPTYVFENPYVTGGLTWAGITWALTSLHAGFWIPAVWISYMADIAVFGPGPGGHHVTNVVVAACSLASRSQLWHWKDTMALWTRASMVELGLDEYSAHMQSGAVLQDKGKSAEARAHFEAAARLKPASADPHVCLALAFSAEGNAESAIAAYREALRLAPAQPVVHNDLGGLLERRGRLEEAIEHFREALRLSPDLAVAHANLALALVKMDRYAEAIPEFQEALRLDPTNDLARRALDALTPRNPDRR
jgi:Tfp pilus assembly protein PilF